MEYGPPDDNQRMVVHNLSRNPQFVHDQTYGLRGEVENCIKGMDLATAQVSTCGSSSFKIEARIRSRYRRLWVHLTSGYHYRDHLAGLLQNLQAAPFNLASPSSSWLWQRRVPNPP